jgi:tetratricopeptide (TPR) repeat protein
MKNILLILVLLLVSHLAVKAQHPRRHDGLPHYVDAETLRKKGQFQQAVTEYEKALRNEPSNHAYLYGKALAEFQGRNSESSVESLSSLFKLKSDYAPAYLLLAQIYQQKGDTDKAVAFFDSAAKYDANIENKIKYKFTITNKYIKDNNFKLAFEKASDMHVLAPKDLKITYYFARLANANARYQEVVNAIISNESAIKALLSNENAKYYYELGFAYFHLNEFAKARQAWDKAKIGEFAAKIEQFSGKHFLNIATTYYKFRDDAQALYYINIAEKIQTDISDTHLLKAQISKRESAKKNKDIKHHLEALIKSEHNSAKKEKYLTDLSEMYLDSEEYDNCLKTIALVAKDKPADLKLKFLKATALYKKSDYKEAGILIQDVLKNSGNPPLDFVMLSAFNAKSMNNNELAKQTFVRLLKSPYKGVAEVELKGMK